MSAELGALSSYALSVQQMQMNLIKANIEMQQQVAEILLDDSRMAPVSSTLGQTLDISI